MFCEKTRPPGLVLLDGQLFNLNRVSAGGGVADRSEEIVLVVVERYPRHPHDGRRESVAEAGLRGLGLTLVSAQVWSGPPCDVVALEQAVHNLMGSCRYAVVRADMGRVYGTLIPSSPTPD